MWINFKMKYLKVKDIFMKEDSNIIRKNQQSKCTCHILLEDETKGWDIWGNEIKSDNNNSNSKEGKQ